METNPATGLPNLPGGMPEAAGLPPVPLPIPVTDHDPTLAAAVAGEKRKRELEPPPPQIAKKKAPLNPNNVMIQELGTGAGSKWNSAGSSPTAGAQRTIVPNERPPRLP